MYVGAYIVVVATGAITRLANDQTIGLTADQGTGCNGQQGFVYPHGGQIIENSIDDAAAYNCRDRTKNQDTQTSANVHNNRPYQIAVSTTEPTSAAADDGCALSNPTTFHGCRHPSQLRIVVVGTGAFIPVTALNVKRKSD